MVAMASPPVRPVMYQLTCFPRNSDGVIEQSYDLLVVASSSLEATRKALAYVKVSHLAATGLEVVTLQRLDNPDIHVVS